MRYIEFLIEFQQPSMDVSISLRVWEWRERGYEREELIKIYEYLSKKGLKTTEDELLKVIFVVKDVYMNRVVIDTLR